MTPNGINILIHCYCSPLPHPRIGAPAVDEELSSLHLNGLIEPDAAGGYHTTDRGRAHIEQLCRTPWPKQAWVSASGEIIEIG